MSLNFDQSEFNRACPKRYYVPVPPFHNGCRFSKSKENSRGQIEEVKIHKGKIEHTYEKEMMNLERSRKINLKWKLKKRPNEKTQYICMKEVQIRKDKNDTQKSKVEICLEFIIF